MTSKYKPGTLGTILLVALGLYLLFIIVVFLGKAFVFTGYNFFFFTDNLLEIKSVNPIVNWGILGLMLGIVAGVIVAIKKYRLSKLLVLYPVLAIFIFVSVMWLINKPTAYTGNLNLPPVPARDIAPVVTQKIYYKVNATIIARSGPSIDDKKIFSLKKRTEVEMVGRRFFDADNAEWFKIKYNDQEAFVNAKYLTFSRTVTSQ
jgi:hypothetical protein